MDYYHDTDPLISSAVYSGVLDLDPYSRTRMMLEDTSSDVLISLNSPDSMQTYNESDMDLTFHDSSSDASVADESTDCVVDIPQRDDDSDIEADRRLVNERFAPYDLFPAYNTWTLEERIDKLLQISPCQRYSRDDLLNIDCIESADKKVDILIEVVSKVHVNHRWNYVHPHELHRGYTVVANCKKEKKKDSEGHSCPKRPMNAFMIWSMKCRALIAQITPQLHNAIISTKLGAAWRKFNDQEKAIYEREKDVLETFHKFEFPDYKYKPKKKAKKADDKVSSQTKQQRGCKRKRSDSSQSGGLRGINIADASQSLDPMLKERLIMKMQIKIDPDLKKGIGKRLTAIDLSELTNYNQLNSLHSISHREQQKRTSLGPNHAIDKRSISVFDTPENSPIKPNTPSSPSDDSLGYDSSSERSFTFENNASLHDSSSTEDSITQVETPAMYIKTEPDHRSSINTEPNFTWNLNFCIKTEPLDYFDAHSGIKSEPTLAYLSVPAEANIPVLSVEAVDSVLDNNECVSSFSNAELLEDFMKYLDNDACFTSDMMPCLSVMSEESATA